MTTQQPEAQQDFLAGLDAITASLSRACLLTAELMTLVKAPDGVQPEEWHECYRASQAVYLAVQLARVAADSERARREPVPYLPAAADLCAPDPAAGHGDLVEYPADK